MTKSTRTCTFPECGRKYYARGLCNGHYQQRRQHGEMWEIGTRRKSFEQRFWEKVDKNGPTHPYRPELGRCWVWTAFKNSKGYGTVGYKDKVEYAHRMSWRMANGDIPDDSVVDHTCHNKSCVNPNHLRLATTKQNAEYRQGAQRNNKNSGVRGVYKAGKLWRVMIRHDQKLHYFGCYPTVAEAESVAIRERARLFTFPEYTCR